MRLMSFRIISCFGFRDSGMVDLDEPSNLIYILGKNSAGKTSLLTALAHLSPSNIPQNHPNFLNYNRDGATPSLIARYTVTRQELSLDQLLQDVLTSQRISNQNDPTLSNSREFQNLLLAVEEKLRPVYAQTISTFEAAQYVWVMREANGGYQFSSEATFKNVSDHVEQVSAALNEALASVRPPNAPPNQMLAQGGWRALNFLTTVQVENLLFRQFPRIVTFDAAYPLLDELPSHITQQNVASDKALLRAFVDLLGRKAVDRFLSAEDPEELSDLLRQMQSKVDDLLNQVNQSSNSGDGPKLLKITLFSHKGLQIAVRSNDKPSFYQHLSPNTRFLFAYYLYLRSYSIKGNILLFDEPNNGFHATAQEDLVNFLRALCENGNLVLVTTHSEYLIDPSHLTGIRLMDSDERSYLHVRNRWYAKTKGKGDFNALRPVLDAIGLRYGSHHLTIHDKVIVAEGTTERLYLQAFHTLLSYQQPLHIAPATGGDTILPVIALLISQGLSFKVVVDASIGRKSIKGKIIEGYGLPDTFIYEVPVPPDFTVPNGAGSGIEDIFSKNDFSKLLTRIIADGSTLGDQFSILTNSEYMKIKTCPVPKRVVAHEFLRLVDQCKLSDFENETLDNTRKLLDFCMSSDWFRM